MSKKYTCEFCKYQVELLVSPLEPIPHTKCHSCGTFIEDADICSFLQSKPDAEIKTKIIGWVADQNRNGAVPKLSIENLTQASARPLPNVVERAERLLLELFLHRKSLAAFIHIKKMGNLVAATYSQNEQELKYLVEMLIGRGWLKLDGPLLQITPEGHIEADRLSRTITSSSKAFVAMSFDKNLNSVYENGFQVGIRNAGYEPFRIDEKDHANKIDDEIIAEIKTAAFVVADFTNHRGGVYFEAGFGLGMNLTVIWTCNENDKEPLHFDIRQYNMIYWDENDHEKLALRLQHRIEANLGKGPITN